MNETTCRYDRDTNEYLDPDGDPCDTPRNQHCQARRTCPNHLAWGELTCGRCLTRTRTDIKQIVERAALMLPEAIVQGVNSEAAMMAGPATDPEAWSWRKVTAMQGRSWHFSQEPGGDDDDWHAFTVLTGWAWQIANSYNDPAPDVWTISNAAAYLDRVLHRLAHDDDQDFRGFAAEIKRCRNRHESVLRDSEAPERGAPCPTCKETGHFVRLNRTFPHWCTNPECTQQFHFTTDQADVWICPRNQEHWWTAQGYADYLEERKTA